MSRALTALLGSGAGEREIEPFESFARVRAVPGGQMVFARDERARAAVLLAHGSVALGLGRGADGFEVERMAHAPVWLDASALWIGAPHGVDARAQGACLVVDLPLEPLRERLLRHPASALRLIQGLAHDLQVAASHTAGLMHASAPVRLAQWLRSHAKPTAAHGGRVAVALTERKRDLAAQLAIAPETLSRLLRRFVQDGVIEVSGYTVVVLDRSALEQLARL